MGRRGPVDDPAIPGDELGWVAFYPWNGEAPEGVATVEEPAPGSEPAE